MMASYFGDTEDLFTSGPTDSNFIDYFVQTTDTSGAAFVAEGVAATARWPLRCASPAAARRPSTRSTS